MYVSVDRNPQNFDESDDVAAEGAKVALATRLQIERSTGKSPITDMNVKGLQKITKV